MDKNIISPSPLQSVAPSSPAHAKNALDARQSLALKEWMRLAKNAQPPRRTDLRPERIREALPVSTLVGVEWNDGRLSFRHRIEGNTLTTVYACTAGGAPFEFTRMLLPFSDEENRVVRVLAVYGFDTDRLLNFRNPLRMTDELAGAGMERPQNGYLRLKTA